MMRSVWDFFYIFFDLEGGKSSGLDTPIFIQPGLVSPGGSDLAQRYHPASGRGGALFGNRSIGLIETRYPGKGVIPIRTRYEMFHPQRITSP